MIYRRYPFFQRRHIQLIVLIITVTLFTSWPMDFNRVWAADSASIARGGRLFDSWFEELKEKPPTLIHGKYQPDNISMHSAETSWRCATCHGWDYRGRAKYGTSALNKGGKGSDIASLVSILTDDNHGYADKLSKQDLADLAAFMADGLIDTSSYIELDSNRVRGDAVKEEGLYATICANCHGTNGYMITTMIPLGDFTRRNPQEALHKVLNGHPAERMPPLRFLDINRLMDLLAYVQTLPLQNKGRTHMASA